MSINENVLLFTVLVICVKFKKREFFFINNNKSILKTTKFLKSYQKIMVLNIRNKVLNNN